MADTINSLNYGPNSFALPAAIALSVIDLENSAAVVPAFGVAITPGNVGTFSRPTVILGAYQNPGKKF
jgi:hypothetical protein